MVRFGSGVEVQVPKHVNPPISIQEKVGFIRLHKIWIHFLFESIQSLHYIAILRVSIVCQDISVTVYF